MRKKITLILVVSFFFTIIMGCWSRVETEDLAIVTIIGIDKLPIQGKEKYRLTLRVVRTGQLGLGQKGGGGITRSPSWLVVGYGDTPQEAINNISTRSPRKIFLAHSKFIVLGEKVAAEGVQDILDLLLRHRDIRLRNWIVVTKGEAERIMETEPELEQLMFEELTGLVENTRSLANKSVAVDLKDFATSLANPGRDVAVSKLEAVIVPEQTNKIDIEKAYGANPEQPAGKTVQITGSAIFKEDKLVGYMGDRETGGLALVIGESREGVFSVSVDEGGFLTYAMTRSEKEINSEVKDKKINFTVKLNIEGDIGEHSNPHEITVEQIVDHEKIVANAIKKQIEDTITAAQKDFQADIFGFGEVLRRQHNSDWKQVKENWREVFPDVKVNVSVEVKIRRQGTISDTLKVE